MKPEKNKERNCIAVGNTDSIQKDTAPAEPSITKTFFLNTAERLRSIDIHIPKMLRFKRRVTVISAKGGRNIIRAAQIHTARSLTAAAGTLIAVFFMFMLFSIYFTPCYEFVVEGATIGYSEDITAYSSALDAVNEELVQSFGDSAVINKSVDKKLAIVRRSSLTDSNEFKENIASLSALMLEAEILSSDGCELAGFKTKEDMDNAVNTFIASVSQENSVVTVLSDITSEKKYVPVSKITAPENVQSVLGGENGIRVQTVTDIVYDEPIPFETVTTEDDTIYEGETQTETEGADGIKSVSATVTAVNGVETDRQITSEQTTAEPVTAVIRTGTRHIPTGIGSGEFIFPTSGTISSHFGTRWNRMHNGLDIAGSTGTPIKAADEGVVSYSGVMNGYGNIIIINHKNGYKTYYGHCSELYANEGDIVSKGDVIAAIGSTGNSTGPHLHFEIRVDDTPVNPENYVSR